MSRAPRILPLVGVAIVGVAAVNALAGAHAVPELFSATRAAAEEALGRKGASKAASASTAQTPAPGQSAAAPSAPPSPLAKGGGLPAPICALSPADLAKQAGMSPAELQVLQSLQARRGQIDDRQKDLDTEVQLLAAAETKLDAKIRAMNGLKADIQALLGQADQKTQAEIDRLVVVYSKMKPQDAAAVMSQLDDKVRLPIAEAMKPAVLSTILGKMGTNDARILTERLAHKFAGVQAAASAANNPDPPKPDQTAAAGASAEASADGPAQPTKTAKAAHRRAPAHRRPAKPEPVAST